MTKVDDDTVKYHLTAPSPIALSVLATGFMGILDSTEAKKHVTGGDPWAGDWLKANTAGFGAYSVTSFKPDEEMRLQANPNYFGDKPDFTTVVIRNVPDGASRAQLLRSGEVDIATELPLDQLGDIEGSDGARVLQQPDVQRHNLVITSGDPELGDPVVRQAVSQAIDREGLVKAVYQGYAEPAQTAIHSALFDQDEALTYDPEAARTAIAKAAGGKRLSMELSISLARPGPYAETIARLIQGDLAKAGVDVKINSVASSATFEGDVSGGKYQSYLYTERPSQPDAGFDLFLYLSSGSPLNNSGYSNPAFDKLSRAALTTPAGKERDRVIGEAVGILEKDLPLIPLVEVPYLIGVSDQVDTAEHLPFGSPAFASITAAGS
jgi:peptide/nickel transport system substrate-binding protein